MKHVLLATVFVIAAFMIVPAQSEEKDQTTVALTAQQAEALVELDKAELAYRRNRFSVAQRHAERAFELDPVNRACLIVIARSIRALYRDNDASPANLVKAREAIAAYLRVSTDPDDDDVYDAVRELYGAIGENELQYAWVLQRAISYNLPTAKRAPAYMVLALLDLNSSRKIIAEADQPLYVKETDTVTVKGLDTATSNEIARSREIASRGLQMAQQAIAISPERDYAWTLEVELLQSIARLFEIEGNESQTEQYRAQASEVAARAADQKARREAAALARMVTVECDTLCDKITSTPRPIYPPIARAARASGEVVVQIEIDSEGKVISATAISGHPLLRAAAVQAARLSTISRTQLSGHVVKVYGSLIYNFTLP